MKIIQTIDCRDLTTKVTHEFDLDESELHRRSREEWEELIETVLSETHQMAYEEAAKELEEKFSEMEYEEEEINKSICESD